MNDSIRARGIVRSHDRFGAHIDFARSAGCGSCATRSICGSNILGSASISQRCVAIHADSEPATGATVEALVSGPVLLAFTGIAYLCPAVLIVVGGWLAGQAVPEGGDVATLIGAALGLCSGAVLLRAGEARRWFSDRMTFRVASEVGTSGDSPY